MAEKSFWSEKKDKEWVANFFFYYTKHIIVILVLIAIVVWGCISCARKVEYDFEMFYLSDKHFDSKVFDNVEQALTDVVDDVDGKHGTVVSFNDYTAVPENAVTSDIDMVMTSKIHVEVAEGHGYLYIMNEDWVKFCVDGGLLEDISEYTGDETPCYFVEVTDNKLLNDLGVKNNGKLYAGIRVLNYGRMNDEIEIKRHKNAIKALQYIIKNK